MVNFTPPPKSLDDMAMEFAMLAPEGYQSFLFGGDALEHRADRLQQEMSIRFGPYQVQNAIKRAYETLKIVDFHKEN